LAFEYHIVIVPVYPWDDVKFNDLNTLGLLIEILDELFRFRLGPELSTGKKVSLFSGRVPHISNEVPFIYEITKPAERASKELVDDGFDLKISHVFATKYAIELVSDSSDVLYKWASNYPCKRICDSLSGLLYKGIKRRGCYLAAIAKIVLCDSQNEVEAFSKELGLSKIAKDLYVRPKEDSDSIIHRVFNFRSSQWPVVDLYNPIVTLKPELADYKTIDEFSFLLTMIHSLGKFYSIFRSTKNISALLEWSSWYVSDLLEKYEKKFCWVQRTFLDIEKELFKFERESRKKISFWSRMSSSFDSVLNVYREYGEDFLQIEWGVFKTILTHFRTKKYITRDSVEHLEKHLLCQIQNFAKQISDFWRNFTKVSNSWKEHRRSSVAQHQLLLSLTGIFLAIIVDIFLKYL
jgi:hypothetical protein